MFLSPFFWMTLVSMILLFGFIIIGTAKFGILPSYSAHSTKWLDVFPKFSLWTVVTLIASMLLVPVLIELGESNPLQFLGFFAPVYLIAVSLTPRWELDNIEHKYHIIFAALCAVAGIAWTLFVAHTAYILLFVAIAVIVTGLLTRTLLYAKTFWAEMVAFLSVYFSILYIEFLF